MSERIAIIADDLTGANDTAVQFWKHGFETVVMVGEAGLQKSVETAEVVALNLDSRVDSPEVAASKVIDAAYSLGQAGVKLIYKKIDSTLRGNLGAETDALLQALDVPAAVITPAFPATQRAVVEGNLTINGVPVTQVVNDPRVTAAGGNQVALLRAQSQHPVALIPLAVVNAGPKPMAAAMRQAMANDARLLAIDAVSEQNLSDIVCAAALAGTGGLLVGSGGLASAWARQLASVAAKAPRTQAEVEDPSSKPAPVLVIAGSYSPVTRRQVEVALEAGSYLVELDLRDAIDLGDKDEITDTAAAAVEFLPAGRGVIVLPTGAMRSGAELEVAKVLAQVATTVLQQLPLGGLVLTGGDIAMATCRNLGATSIVVTGEVAPGLPAGRLQGGLYSGLPIVTKAGAFGSDDALYRAIQYLGQTAKRV